MSDSTPIGARQTRPWAPLLAIAATYFYFLIFAEFAFLEIARGIVPTASGLQLVMAALGAGGVAGAVGAALAGKEGRMLPMLSWAFRGCALTAGLALVVGNRLGLTTVAFLVGVSLGALTVLLAATLRAAVGLARLGWWIGGGTGLAYAACNLPAIFHAPPGGQTWLATLAVAAASFLPRWFGQEKTDTPAIAPGTRGAVARWTMILLALVWLDSAAFYIVQHTPALRAETWSTSGKLIVNAAIHLLAALAAGWAIDRGARVGVATVAFGALAGAALILNGSLPMGWSAHLFYTAGVSLYSVVLVEYPARTGRPAVAAIVFAVAGWLGSALGIGMAQDLAHIPTAFVVAAGVTVLLAGQGRVGAKWIQAAPLLLLLLTARAGEVESGRSVYLAEGCMHCHSQYVRPRVTRDVVNWGPAATLEAVLDAAPPLFGNRRQGPDLARVGNRRSAEWNRLHLMAPGAVSPGSRMPSYAHLFSGADGRGEALVAYLAALGADTIDLRQRQIAAWQPDASAAISPAASAQLFQRLCTPCHGAAGRGDGPLAPQLVLRPADWQTSRWRHVPAGADSEVVLSRIIKFGILGLAMAGHEYLPDAEIVGLARYVRFLHEGSDRASAVVASP